MSPKKKGGAAAKPPAQPKAAPSTSRTTAAPTPKPSTTTNPGSHTAPTRPSQPSSSAAATSSTQRVSPQPQAGSSRPGVTINPNPVAPSPKAPAQPSRPTAQPMKSALASHLRNAPAPGRTGSSQQHTFTRSDRVRAEWLDFEEKWVAPRQRQIERELEELFQAAERTSRNKSKSGRPDGMDKIVNAMQRDFALAARAEWEARLERAHLQAEDWVDITPEEMAAVEQVLDYEESDDEPGVYAQLQRGSVRNNFSSSPIAQPIPSQETSASQPLHNTQPVASRHATAAAAPEQLKASSRGGQASTVTENVRVQSNGTTATLTSAISGHDAQPSTKRAQITSSPPVTSSDLLVYAVPVSLSAPPLDRSLLANTEFMDIVERLHINSIRQFHMKAAEADAELARQLRKPMPPADREFTIRAHQMTMEQSARDIVARRNKLMAEERKKRGLGGPGGDSAPPPPVQSPLHARPQQPPVALPEERTPPAQRTEPPLDLEPILEYAPDAKPDPQPEPEQDVDEVIEIPIKGKGKKKGKKAVVETRSPANGRAVTPTPAGPSTAQATSAKKTSSATDVKSKPAAQDVPAVDVVKAPAPARAASPAPINTKVATSISATDRTLPVAGPSSGTPTPWELYQTKTSVQSAASEAKAGSISNGFWAPPMARAASSNKNSFAPTRPSRLAQVTPAPESPESPEPPSPPHEPTGRDYVAWFAGSSSEDEESASEEQLDEDEDVDDEEQEGGGTSGFGSLLASLAGGSPWALFGGESSQPQRGRAASPARGRGTTPTPARAATARFAPSPDVEPAYARWGAPHAGLSHHGAGPSAAPSGLPGMWKGEGDDLDQILEIASSALDKAATGSGRHGAVNVEEAMAMYVTAAKARETLATPVGGRSARRR
ncbi:hypothetical protein BD414DRAFT_279156 [Trametes punicea]|nr:hypothetical protein BD414DRAFT_279156 [Trametes punicea]